MKYQGQREKYSTKYLKTLGAFELRQVYENSALAGGIRSQAIQLSTALENSKRCDDGCPGWAHFNVGFDREGIEACMDCGLFDDDEAAAIHAKHCQCGAGAGIPIQRCHGCGKSPIPAVVIFKDERAFCSRSCAQ